MYQPINILTGPNTAGKEIYKPERIQARTADLLLAFAVDDQTNNFWYTDHFIDD